jgi:hypothetical protein
MKPNENKKMINPASGAIISKESPGGMFLEYVYLVYGNHFMCIDIAN